MMTSSLNFSYPSSTPSMLYKCFDASYVGRDVSASRYKAQYSYAALCRVYGFDHELLDSWFEWHCNGSLFLEPIQGIDQPTTITDDSIKWRHLDLRTIDGIDQPIEVYWGGSLIWGEDGKRYERRPVDGISMPTMMDDYDDLGHRWFTDAGYHRDPISGIEQPTVISSCQMLWHTNNKLDRDSIDGIEQPSEIFQYDYICGVEWYRNDVMYRRCRF